MQHAVAEHIARHVADAHHGEVGCLDVDAEFAEMALYELPDAPRGDAHCLVVVPHRAAGSECVAEPIPVFSRDRVGEIGELSGPLVGGYYEIGVIAVIADDLGRRLDPVFCRGLGTDVVGEVEQTADQRAVAFDPFGPQLVGRRRRLLDDKPAL